MLFRATISRRLIAALAIALHGLGAVVGGLGHSHVGDAACCKGFASVVCSAEATSHQHAGHQHASGMCSHSHEHATPAPDAPQPAGDPKQSGGPHDDCSLCRHFSQPVSPVTLSIEIPPADRAYSLDVHPVEQLAVPVLSAHLARGPPASCA